jgi:type IV secretion system protein VirD4
MRTRSSLPLADGELALGAGLVLLAAAVGAADVAGALVSHTRLVGLSAATRFLVAALRVPGSPTLAWRGGRHAASSRGSALAFWGLTTALLVPPAAVVLATFLRFVRHRQGAETGFASQAELRQSASVGAARRAARVTRPSLDARHAPASAVGYPLGRSTTTTRHRGVALVASWEHSLELVAPPGAGKTLRVLSPILRQHPGPALATSTKPDLYEISVGCRRRIGPVFAVDPDRLCPAAPPLRWSPVAGCEDSRVAERRAAALVAAVGDGSDVRSGSFFRRSAAAVLTAYLHAAALEGATMRAVVAWSVRPNDPAPRRALARADDATVDWGARLYAHTSGAEETTSGVMRTVDLALSCFSDPDVLAQVSVTKDNAFDFEAFFDACGTVFALGKDRGPVGGTGPLVTAFCDELLVSADRRAAGTPARRLDPPLLACLDEAPSIAPLPGLPTLLADGRGRGIVTLVAMQSFSQAVARWGEAGAATIRNAASILAVFGGLGVADDLDELSRLTGTRQVEREGWTEDARGRSSTNRHVVEEPVLSPAEIRALPAGTALLLWGRLPPVLAHLPGIWEGKAGHAVMEEERAEKQRNDQERNGR